MLASSQIFLIPTLIPTLAQATLTLYGGEQAKRTENTARHTASRETHWASGTVNPQRVKFTHKERYCVENERKSAREQHAQFVIERW